MKLEAQSCSSNSSESSTSDLIESFPPLETTVSPKENINSLYSIISGTTRLIRLHLPCSAAIVAN